MKPRLPFDCTHHARRPAGLVVSWPYDREAPRFDLGAYFAACACLEAASVIAFVQLAGDLTALSAPATLVGEAIRAQEDAVGQAERAMQLARQFEMSPATFSITRRARTKLNIACTNAVEGCVRQAYGASVAAWQAKTAKGPEVREAFAQMASNKARHVGLARSIAKWLEPQLDPNELAIVHEARGGALASIADEVVLPVAPMLVNVAGLPTTEAALSLLAELEAMIVTERS